MNRSVLLAAGASLALFAPARATQEADWEDASPHEVRLVTVDQDVELEVLDWGGSGPSVVLLAGLGATAHQYDDFAPLLTDRYSVVGITRRGHRGSSPAPDGYDFARLADDVLRVIGALGLADPVVLGHSFAGEEMHLLGAHHAGAIRGLVYVDAAFDRGDDADSEAFNEAAGAVPSRGPQATDLASFAALRAYLVERGGAGPEGHLRTLYRTKDDGTLGRWAPETAVLQAMSRAIRAAYDPYAPDPIRVPAVAIYAVPETADDLMHRGSSDRLPSPKLVAEAAADTAVRQRVETLFRLTRERVSNHEAWFEALADDGRVVELSGTHDLIVSNPEGIVRELDGFMKSLASGAPDDDGRVVSVEIQHSGRESESGQQTPAEAASGGLSSSPLGRAGSDNEGLPMRASFSSCFARVALEGQAAPTPADADERAVP